MEISTISQDPTIRPVSADDEPELDLYTIPTFSSWFSWDEIHETERIYFREFFDGSSISRTPRVYKEYRDFIITKYREDPSRRLTFTEVRKSLVGDVSLLHKVFEFLEKWGLINFAAAPSSGRPASESEEGEERCKVRAEDGAPHGVRVVANPNSLKPLPVPNSGGDEGGTGFGFKLPPLASYSDVFGELVKQKKGLVCANCGEGCQSGHYECTEGSSIICVKCFKNGNYGENMSADDFKFNDCMENTGTSGTIWTEAENLLLLESVLKHGDDWQLVAQNVQTKTKLECISRLIEMPFGDLMLGSFHGKNAPGGISGNMSCTQQVPLNSSESQDTAGAGDLCHEQTNECKLNGEAETHSPPLKKKRVASLSDTDNSLMKQVARISGMFGPNIATAAAGAAVTELCEEIPFAKELFDHEEVNVPNEVGSPSPNDEPERVLKVEDSDMKEMLPLSETREISTEKNAVPLTLRIRAAVATALGTAAAHAKLLADQEVKEMGNLVVEEIAI
ncbi:SWI/SNF complex subunit SWI3A isoform X2 [Malania oleifera]|uniref:SWI/SNF complex subunit SWI3A isoform X2 n=1 Tax=Malania oleifera TaxID=397392 RepID=UPI0025ADFB27|nr:SWI/SNF complex subunit SWI3A isoform X2 [Malania oleifera]